MKDGTNIYNLNFKKMKKASKFFLALMVIPFVFISCGNNIAKQLKEEMKTLKSQCPQDQGNGVTLTDVNFYEKEKVLEYVCSIAGMDSLDASITILMKEAMVEALSSGVSISEKISINTIMKTYDYRFRYIYNNLEGNKLCEIEITKSDLK